MKKLIPTHSLFANDEQRNRVAEWFLEDSNDSYRLGYWNRIREENSDIEEPHFHWVKDKESYSMGWYDADGDILHLNVDYSGY